MNEFKKYRLSLVCEDSRTYEQIHGTQDAIDFFRQEIGDADREHFVVMALDGHMCPIGWTVAHIGTLTMSVVHPREVFKFAIRRNACTIIIAHNHPSSGDIKPSQEDLVITDRLQKAGEILGIKVLDHLIVSPQGGVSLKELNLI